MEAQGRKEGNGCQGARVEIFGFYQKVELQVMPGIAGHECLVGVALMRIDILRVLRASSAGLSGHTRVTLYPVGSRLNT